MKIKPDLGTKERLFELMKKVDKNFLNESLTPEMENILEECFDKLKNGMFKAEKGGKVETNMTTENGISYATIDGYISNKHCKFNFKIEGLETTDDVINVNNVKLIEFYYQEEDNEFSLKEEDLHEFNNNHSSDEIVSVIEQYLEINIENAPEEENLDESTLIFDPSYGEKLYNLVEEFNLQNSQPFGGSKDELQNGMGYADEKPINPKLRVKSPELEKFVSEEENNDENVANIRINNYPWYLKKIDGTHFFMSNNINDKGMASHIEQHREEPYYADVKNWLHGGESPNGKSYYSNKGFMESFKKENQNQEDLKKKDNLKESEEDKILKIAEQIYSIIRESESEGTHEEEIDFEDNVLLFGYWVKFREWNETSTDPHGVQHYSEISDAGLNYVELINEYEKDILSPEEKLKIKNFVEKWSNNTKTKMHEEENNIDENAIKDKINKLIRYPKVSLLINSFKELLKSKKYFGEDDVFKKLVNIYSEYLSEIFDEFNTHLSSDEIKNYFYNSTNHTFNEEVGIPKNDGSGMGIGRGCEENELNKPQDIIHGGLGDNAKPTDFDKNQLLKGIEVEMEHTDDPKIALEIAMDHLTEIPDYYTRLDAMEKEAGVEDEKDETSPDEKITDELLGFDQNTPDFQK